MAMEECFILTLQPFDFTKHHRVFANERSPFQSSKIWLASCKDTQQMVLCPQLHLVLLLPSLLIGKKCFLAWFDLQLSQAWLYFFHAVGAPCEISISPPNVPAFLSLGKPWLWTRTGMWPHGDVGR